MKKLTLLVITLLSMNSFSATTVETKLNSANSQSAAKITIKGSMAKKLIDYLFEVSQFAGSHVSIEGVMGKTIVSGPGLHCKMINNASLFEDEEDRTAENMFSCEISFGSKGMINL